MHTTIITHPGLERHASDIKAITLYTIGARVLDDYLTPEREHLTLARSLSGRYLVHVHGHGYHRLTAVNDKTEAGQLFQLLRDVHGIGSIGIG